MGERERERYSKFGNRAVVEARNFIHHLDWNNASATCISVHRIHRITGKPNFASTPSLCYVNGGASTIRLMIFFFLLSIQRFRVEFRNAFFFSLVFQEFIYRFDLSLSLPLSFSQIGNILFCFDRVGSAMGNNIFFLKFFIVIFLFFIFLEKGRRLVMLSVLRFFVF